MEAYACVQQVSVLGDDSHKFCNGYKNMHKMRKRYNFSFFVLLLSIQNRKNVGFVGVKKGLYIIMKRTEWSSLRKKLNIIIVIIHYNVFGLKVF